MTKMGLEVIRFLVVVLLLLQYMLSAALSTPTRFTKVSSALPAFSFLQDILDAGKASDLKERELLKDQLLAACDQPKPSRESIEGIMAQLKNYSPVQACATSNLLQKKWDL